MTIKHVILYSLSFLLILSNFSTYHGIHLLHGEQIKPVATEIAYNGIVDSDLVYCEFYQEYPALCIMTA